MIVVQMKNGEPRAFKTLSPAKSWLLNAVGDWVEWAKKFSPESLEGVLSLEELVRGLTEADLDGGGPVRMSATVDVRTGTIMQVKVWRVEG